LAQQANRVANPTPTQAPIDAILGGLVAIVASLATSWQHRQAQAAAAATAAAVAEKKTS
jgi:hypothetical protein